MGAVLAPARSAEDPHVTVSAPASVFMRLLAAYRRHGYRVRAGLNPHYFADPDAAFAHFFDQAGRALAVGGGIDPQELHFLELLVGAGVRPERVLIIGNAFGWSTLAMGMLLPSSTVVAMEADLEGDSTAIGTALTAKIGGEEGLNVRVVQALSPRDTAAVVAREFDGKPLDLVFVDGLHVNEQLVRDVEGVLPFCGEKTVIILHDVLSWHMVQAFESIEFGPGRERRILTRTPSGIGLVYPSDCPQPVRDVIDTFCDETVDIGRLFSDLGATPEMPGRQLEARFSKGWKYRRLGMAKTHACEGRLDDERREVAQLAAERPHDPIALYELGVWDTHHSRWSDGIKSLRTACALAPTWAAPAHQLGRALREAGQLQEARSCLGRAATLEPTWAAPHLELGFCASAEDDHTQAAAHFSAALALDPSWRLAELEFGLASFRSGETATAKRVLTRVLESAPNEASACHALALATESTDGITAALDLFRRAASLNRSSADAQFDLARALTASGDLAAATQMFLTALELRPDWAEAHFDLGTALMRAGDEAGASAHFARAMTLRPEWTDARLACGRLAYDQQAFALCVDAVAPLASRPDAPADAVHLLALSLERTGDLEQARTWLVRASELIPDSADVALDLGRIATALGDDRSAVSHFAAAIRLRPTWDEARALCGAAAWRLRIAAQRVSRGDGTDGSRRQNVTVLTDEGRNQSDTTSLCSDQRSPPARLDDGGITSAERSFDLGRVCARDARYSEALEHFQRACTLRPDWIEARVAAFEAATVLDDREEAGRSLRVLTEMLPCSPALWYERGMNQARSGNGVAAEHAISRGMALELWTEPVKATAEVLLSHGGAESALAILDAALAQKSSWAGAHFVRGRALELLGRASDAHSAYQRASALQPAWRDAAASAARTAPVPGATLSQSVADDAA